jgi:very-short-patch-repair endonuclease
MKAGSRGHRKQPTEAEATLWAAVRRQQLDGIQIRRQYPIDRFILDFYCPSRKLCIELDGPIHERLAEYDQNRTECLALHGIRVIRFRNEEVLSNLDSVLQRIRGSLSLTE